MNRVEFPIWSDEIEKSSAEIYRVTAQIKSVQKKLSTNDILCSDDNFQIFYDNVCDTLNFWAGCTYVGRVKNKQIKKSFQAFFEALYDFLIFCKTQDNRFQRLLGKFADDALYQGTLYRYLGHGSSVDNIDKAIEPEYNNIWVSWSKNPTNSYVMSKLYGLKTILTCEVNGNHYGIDLNAFGVVKGEEAEVVFPTIKEMVTNIDYIE